MRENNPMFSDDTKQKVHEWWEANPDKKAKRTANFIAGKQQLQRNKPNKLEIKAQHILKEFGVEFEPFAIIKPKFIVDFLIGHLVLQIDGEYWHGHPRCNPLTERQKAQRKRDKDQDKYLTECGYTVVRVWERDVNKKYFHNILNQHGLL